MAVRPIIAFIFLCAPLIAADQWIKVSTSHFELFTIAGEKKGREAILYFEQVRSFFLQASPSKSAPEFPVRIVAFRGEKQYQPYRVSESAFAYYVQSRTRDYIVMQDIVSDHYPAVIHEYMHLIINHSGLKMPVWLNEGWADLFSTLKPMGKKAVVGDIIPGRAQALLTNKLLPIEVLTSVGHNSPLYNERDKASIFYAQSWALTHMLFFAPDYRPSFPKFVETLSRGKSMDEACQMAFHKRMWEVDNDFKAYIRGDKFYHMTVDIKLEKSDEEPDVADATPFDSGMVLADLLIINKRTDAARTALEQAGKLEPNRPEVEESLGYLAWSTNDELGARQHFAHAFEGGSKDPQMCFHYAMLEWRARSSDMKPVIAALRKAVELKPNYIEARLQLGQALLNDRNYSEALNQFNQIRSVKSEDATHLFAGLAYAYMQTGDENKARENAEAAKKWAKTPEQIQRADSILRYLDAQNNRAARTTAPREGPPVLRHVERPAFEVKEEYTKPPDKNPFIAKEDKMNHVEGIASKLDCGGDTLMLHVKVDGKTMIFEIPDPDRVVIKHSGEIKHDFACGGQQGYKIAVDYAALPDAKNGSTGIVRGLEF